MCCSSICPSPFPQSCHQSGRLYAIFAQLVCCKPPNQLLFVPLICCDRQLTSPEQTVVSVLSGDLVPDFLSRGANFDPTRILAQNIPGLHGELKGKVRILWQ